MHNWLIFQYHRVRAQSQVWGTKGLTFGSNRPTPRRVAKEGTQEGR